MNPLNLKLFRDLWQAREQVIAIALVVACGIASFVMARSAYTSLTLTQNTYYNEYHFAQVFASLKRTPETLKEQIAEIFHQHRFNLCGGNGDKLRISFICQAFFMNFSKPLNLLLLLMFVAFALIPHQSANIQL